ncbi:MAG: EAL domain-containing response regulator [Gammaproteobacteria bacterium]|nr:EAL domain-containing response regulator [Gammaproteobacteria bacterium]NNC97811.1 EAL domain-containing response regulator [Gammaproteobacteria bacterium]NNM13846.1 EAL domain-containing response regulator [Gammaproteobacteria bacterium]
MTTSFNTNDQLTLLVYDDDREIFSYVKTIAKGLGYRVLCANNFSEFRAQNSHDIDIIMLGLQMSDHDGVEILRYLKKIESQAGIIITSSALESVLKASGRLASSHSLRYMGYLLKPYEQNALERKLTQEIPELDKPRRRNFPEFSRNDVRRCIAKDEIVMFYQPKIDIETLQFVSVEALVRWQHPDLGILGPGAFLPLVEELNMIGTMTTLIMEKAYAQVKSWEKIGLSPKIAVNLSARSFFELDLPEQFVSIATKYEVPIDRITLEITESWDAQDSLIALDIMTRLRLKGFNLSIDDFGTGYSSMTQLKDIPFTELKLDQSFVRGATDDGGARAIVESCIELGHKLGLHVVAEGVETQTDWELVSDLGCDEGQGYFIARPMPGDNIPNWLERWNVSLGLDEKATRETA